MGDDQSSNLDNRDAELRRRHRKILKILNRCQFKQPVGDDGSFKVSCGHLIQTEDGVVEDVVSWIKSEGIKHEMKINGFTVFHHRSFETKEEGFYFVKNHPYVTLVPITFDKMSAHTRLKSAPSHSPLHSIKYEEIPEEEADQSFVQEERSGGQKYDCDDDEEYPF